MMLLICVPMLLGRKHGHDADPGASKQEVADLREEISRLKGERAIDDKAEALDG
jgi:hypothetical protein